MADAETKLPDGWIYLDYSNTLQSSGGSVLLASSDPSLWARQINDFEFADGPEWSPEQLAAMRREASEGPAKIRCISLTLEYVPPSVDPAQERDISVSTLAWADWRRRVTAREVRKIKWSAPNDPASFNPSAADVEKINALTYREPSRELATLITAVNEYVLRITGLAALPSVSPNDPGSSERPYHLRPDGFYWGDKRISTNLGPVTLNMLNHADAILQANGIMNANGEMIETIYRAMKAMEPDTLQSPPSDGVPPWAQDALAEVEDLKRQLVNAYLERDEAHSERDDARAERGSARAEADQMRAERNNALIVAGQYVGKITALRAELRAAHDALGQRPAPAEPKPSNHNPFREFPGDRRRVGG